MLQYASRDPIHRRWNHNELTFSMIYAYSENFILPFSHDEVVHGKRSLLDKMPGDEWQKRATLRLLFGVHVRASRQEAAVHGRRSSGSGASGTTTRVSTGSCSTSRATQGSSVSSATSIACMPRCRRCTSATTSRTGFGGSTAPTTRTASVSVLRTAADPADHVVAVFNFTPVPRRGYAVGVPHAGFYREVLNTDSTAYGGSGVGNLGGLESVPSKAHGYDQMLALTVPPLGGVLLAPMRAKTPADSV